MTESESVALPFGDSPKYRSVSTDNRYYTLRFQIMQQQIYQNTWLPITIPVYPELILRK